MRWRTAARVVGTAAARARVSRSLYDHSSHRSTTSDVFDIPRHPAAARPNDPAPLWYRRRHACGTQFSGGIALETLPIHNDNVTTELRRDGFRVFYVQAIPRIPAHFP